jgi:hypothetical protein
VPKPERRREPVFKEPVMKKINVPSYWREGELVRAYKKTPNKRWDDKEIKFITKLIFSVNL